MGPRLPRHASSHCRVSYAEEGDLIFAEVVTEATHTGPLAYDNRLLNGTGRRVSYGAVQIAGLRAGRIAWRRVYLDPSEFLAQLGASARPDPQGAEGGVPVAAYERKLKSVTSVITEQGKVRGCRIFAAPVEMEGRSSTRWNLESIDRRRLTGSR